MGRTVRQIRDAKPSATKDGTLLKLGTFNNNYRNNANLEKISGIEGDYDKEVVTPEEAAAMLEAAGIASLVATSWSHTPEMPRWRVWVPLSQPRAADERYDLVARLNGALGGILADESFTDSQAFYVGYPEGSARQVIETNGRFLDEIEGLPEIGRPAGRACVEAVNPGWLLAPSIEAVEAVLEQVPAPETRTDAIAVGQAVAGACGGEPGRGPWMVWLERHEGVEGIEGEGHDSPDANYDRILANPTGVGWARLCKRAGDAGRMLGAQHEFQADQSLPVQKSNALDNPGGAEEKVSAAVGTSDSKPSRRVNLGPFLDGTFKAPVPSVGAPRADGTHMLYPGRWHTLIAPTGTGKTWWLLMHAKQVLDAGGTVVYCHFEEIMPGGTIERLRALRVPTDVIRERFVWLSCERSWTPAEVRAELDAVKPDLVLLDGINAAGTQHGQDVEKVGAVGWYRATFVTPAVARGAAVISAGHPVKARDRQDERHGFGSSAWLDEVDGVAFRLVAGSEPIRRGHGGSAALYSVKDRYGSVEQHAAPHGKYEGWKYVGHFVVEDDPEMGLLSMSVTTPEDAPAGGGRQDPIDALGERIMEIVAKLPGKRFDSNRRLVEQLRAASIGFSNENVEPALIRLETEGRVARDPDPGARKPRGGSLLRTAPNCSAEQPEQQINCSAAPRPLGADHGSVHGPQKGPTPLPPAEDPLAVLYAAAAGLI